MMNLNDKEQGSVGGSWHQNAAQVLDNDTDGRDIVTLAKLALAGNNLI